MIGLPSFFMHDSGVGGGCLQVATFIDIVKCLHLLGLVESSKYLFTNI